MTHSRLELVMHMGDSVVEMLRGHLGPEAHLQGGGKHAQLLKVRQQQAHAIAFDFEKNAPVRRVEPGPVFQARGSEEIYFCDRCLIRAAARAQRIRSGLYLVLGSFAIVVVIRLILH